jgi:hypothetical protein
MNTYDNLVEKWSPVLNEETAGSITDSHKRSVTAALLENTEKALLEERQLTEAAPTNSTGSNVANWDPILISLVRRAAPNMLAYDLAGVQPMSGPTGLIFAMKSKYTSQGGTEALFNEADTRFSGTQNSAAQPSSPSGLDVANANDVKTIDSDRLTALAGGGMDTDSAEALGDAAGNAFAEMGFSIEKATVTAKSRALKAEYSLELAQDLKAIHGLDAETELANILSTEILSEMNREVIRTINSQAKSGAQQSNVAVRGIFNMSTDADGRWSAEKFKGLMVQIEREANAIAKETRRGKGNVVMCSSDVASALAAAGMLDYAPAIAANLNVDDTGNLFAGVLNGRTKVYIDPYATVDYVTVGYKGTNPYDAGVFYCPYVPLTMMRAVGEDNFQPKIGFKTRYGMVSNPFVGAASGRDGLATAKTNQYYRIFRVDNIMVSA